MNKTVLSCSIIWCLLSIVPLVGYEASAKASSDIIYVPTDYSTIQEAINHANEGATIFVYNGTYPEHVVVDRTVSFIGQNRSNTIIDGSETGIVVFVTVDGVTIRGFTVKNGSIGIYIDHSNNSRVMENNLIHNVDAIFVSSSYNCTISQNLVENNTHRGILIANSKNFNVNGNYVFGSGWYGINANASADGLIIQNELCENYFDGIGLLNSNNCTIARNNVDANVLLGLWLESSGDNVIYHNNFINNGIQTAAGALTSRWDNGFEGNYWSNYNGNDTNHDGLGDGWFEIQENNIDHYPLMGMFSSFNASLRYHVNVISNSIIEDFDYFESNSTIKVHVYNMIANPAYGFCRITIPHNLMFEPYNVTIDGVSPIHWNYTLYDNGTHRWIYFSYEYSTSEIVIIPEFSSFTVLSLFMIATLLIIVVCKKYIIAKAGYLVSKASL